MALPSVRLVARAPGTLFRNTLCLLKTAYRNELALTRSCSSASVKASSSGWDLVGAVALERKPVIMPELNALEKKYLEVLRSIEVEGSLLSDHELQLLEDKKKREDPEEGVAIKVQTAQDIEEEWTKKAKEFKPASRLTEADSKGDTRTTQRCLDQALLLVVNQQLGKGHRWILPQALHANGETMRQTAERALTEVCGPALEAFFLGNAPAGCYSYNYPPEFQKNGIQGAKVFFFKAQLKNGALSVSDLKKLTKADDFAWLTYKELSSKMLPRYCKAVQSFLMVPEETPYQHLLDRALSSITWQKSSITPEISCESKYAAEAVKS
ncbi:39S ribosomal protein L46, mitochondrial-like [Dermacentor silvarum]|uniref:39S ribosomal protein L46, mitochondrial-like n=1 Tax=Dermacentor silvarum TaxID=543639 RepID=UPI0018983CFF|nr:39S ribosomal protein L46, mitochondrial-like [Dermacentor silvarum]